MQGCTLASIIIKKYRTFMISLYESLLADIDDTLDQGDTISADILANDENSLLRKVFPVNSRLKNPYEILEQNGKKMLSLKTSI